MLHPDLDLLSPSSSSFPSSDQQWAELIAWASSQGHLSRPIRHPARDFSDGALVAEIVALHLPHYVCSLNSFPQVHSLALKKYNWEMLERVVLRHLGLRLSITDIDALAGAEEGAILRFLPLLRDKIGQAVAQRRFRPSSATGQRSRSSSRGGSQLELDKIGGMEWKQEKKKKGQNGGGGERPRVRDDEMDKEQLVEKLYAKVRAQEIQLRKKDEQIEALSRKVDKLLELVCEETKGTTKQWEEKNNGRMMANGGIE